MNSLLLTDSYKVAHHKMLPENCTMLYGNWTPRSNKWAPEGITKVVSAGQIPVISWINDHFIDNFFDVEKYQVLDEIKRELEMHLGMPYDISHFEKLHDLGYLPICFKSLPEGVEVPMGVPIMTWYNTHKDFAWLSLYLETIISNMLWKPMTSATLALNYKRLGKKWLLKTDPNAIDFLEFQFHDFSFRGLGGFDGAWLSGLGHLYSFKGSDTLPAISAARSYYKDEGFVCGSVAASEHSVSSACIATMGEQDMISYYMDQYPTGILSIVSDTFDLWKLITEYLPSLKDKILSRDGKLVIRPDSGDPVDIICGKNSINGGFLTRISRKKAEELGFEDIGKSDAEFKGVIELLWDIFGGTINDQGYKVLDPHIGAIYGDSINLERAKQIFKRLEVKGFASSNIVLGVGSFTYQFNTRDAFGFAAKGTYVIVNNEGIPIFKDPVTDSGLKKSAKGLLKVILNDSGDYELINNVSIEEEEQGELKVLYKDGSIVNQYSLQEVRNNINKLI